MILILEKKQLVAYAMLSLDALQINAVMSIMFIFDRFRWSLW